MQIIVNLSKDVFERRTSTGSGFFSFLDSGFAHFLGQLVSIIVKTLRNTNLGASRCFKMKKTSLPVDVRRSKTPLLLNSKYSRFSCENEDPRRPENCCKDPKTNWLPKNGGRHPKTAMMPSVYWLSLVFLFLFFFPVFLFFFLLPP